MADANGGGSNRDASGARPRVQQLRPTNKDVQSTVPTVPLAPNPIVPRSDANGSASTAAPAPAKVIPRIVTGQASGSTILVNNCQRGNPILQHIRNIGWEYQEIVPDYQVGDARCVLYLSLRYHRLHPEYIHSRIQKLGRMYDLRVLLVMCDVDQSQSAIKELTKVAIINNLTLMVAWTAEEAGSYIERYKAFEHKAPDLIRERVNDDYMSQLHSALTNIKGVNKTDVITLATNFGSFKRIVEASGEDLSQCPGFGATKVKRIKDIFSQPFRVGETRTGRERRAERQRLYGSQEVDPPSSNLQRGRFIEDDEERQMLSDLRQESLSQKVTNPSAYVTPRNNTAETSQTISDPDVEEEVEDADDWDIMDGMTEEEHLLMALELSRSGS